MKHHVRLSRESLPTNAAGKGFFSSVCLLMTNHVGFTCEFSVTDATGKRPFTRVRSLVIVEAVFPDEAFGAEPASIRLLSNVQFLMSVQVPSFRKASLAHTAAERPLVGVSPRAREHVALLTEEFLGSTVHMRCPSTIHFFMHYTDSCPVVAF